MSNTSQKQLFLLTGYVADLTDELSGGQYQKPVVVTETSIHQQVMDATERGVLIAALNGFNGDKEATAEWLGLTTDVFMQRLSHNNLNIGDFVDPENVAFPDFKDDNPVVSVTAQGNVPEDKKAAIAFSAKLIKDNAADTGQMVDAFMGSINIQMGVLRGLFSEEATPGINNALSRMAADSTNRVPVITPISSAPNTYYH